MKDRKKFSLGIIFGGPSEERGISLNSARSIMDHVKSENLEIIPILVGDNRQFYLVSEAWLYSNTPADFDFKLAGSSLDETALKKLLQSIDLVFPAIHGIFGEDGELQELLEKSDIPFVGHSSGACKKMFPKHLLREGLSSIGFPVIPQIALLENMQNCQQTIQAFFLEHQISRAIVKPAIGGSSIGVSSVTTPKEAYDRVKNLFSARPNSTVLLESFCKGTEFTIVVFEGPLRKPIALIPTEVQLDYSNHSIFDYRKKYLPTNQAIYHTPPKFSKTIVMEIRSKAEKLFTFFGMRDFVRIDGWVMDSGTIYFTDINPISGLEQNSFLFRQTALLGMTHRETLEYILQNACRRYAIAFPEKKVEAETNSKIPVYVLFGGGNAERQVSLMSGTNVWLKLLRSESFSPFPFLYASDANIWQLPYSFPLNHTVEEVYANCLDADENEEWNEITKNICLQLNLKIKEEKKPSKMSFTEFLEGAKRENAFVFIALHGGAGEDGTLQRHLEEYELSFNGSNAAVSALCMDKYLTGCSIQAINDPDVISLPKKSVCLTLFAGEAMRQIDAAWNEWCEELGSPRLIVKPRSDGCSAGIVLLQSSKDLYSYCKCLQEGFKVIPPFTFMNQENTVEMPYDTSGEFLLEPYIEVDRIVVKQNKLMHSPVDGWIELTVGVLEKKGIYRTFNPSITVTEGFILSLEEKFQGGTGINLTPPPEEILSFSQGEKIKQLVERVAVHIGVQNYARMDIFFNRITEKMIVIEINTLPALTPSTVLYHQALAENPPLTPLDLLHNILQV